MAEQRYSDLLLSDEKVSRLLDKTMAENPSQYLAVVLQIEVTRCMLKEMDKLTDEFSECAKRTSDSIDNK
jgi:hypothetical protein